MVTPTTPAAKKAPVSKAAAKAAAPPAEETPETAAVAAPAEETPAAVPTEAAPAPEVSSMRFDSLVEKLQSITTMSKDLVAQVRFLQKEVVKLQKEKLKAEQLAAKTAVKKDKKAANAAARLAAGEAPVKRSPSGFAKPTKLSEELCSFLGVPPGTEMARTDVTRMLNNYIKQHSLQDPADKRSIKPNADLQKILEPGDVTYFNLQAKIKRHFIKA
jgi:chromatin remodeling complex protein RSC6